MKANKKGISLIVLIITIVVIIILAAAIILNLSQTNIIENANTAVTKNDETAAQEAFTLWLSDRWVENTAEIGYKYSGTITDSTTTLTVAGKTVAGDADGDGTVEENETVPVTVTVTLSDLGVANSLESITIENNVVTAIVKK